MFAIKRDQKIEHLKKVPMFSKLSNRHLVEIAKHAESISVKAGKVLIKQGDIGLEFIFIVEGKAQVQKNGKTIRQLTVGDFFGEISLIDREPRTASVIAITEMKLLVVSCASFDNLLEKVPDIQEKVMLALCRYIRRAESLPDLA